jgi:hypothetical protein
MCTKLQAAHAALSWRLCDLRRTEHRRNLRRLRCSTAAANLPQFKSILRCARPNVLRAVCTSRVCAHVFAAVKYGNWRHTWTSCCVATQASFDLFYARPV